MTRTRWLLRGARILACLCTLVSAGARAQEAGAGEHASPVLAHRAYIFMRFGQLGSATLRTPVAELEGTPTHSYGLGARFDLSLLRHLNAGVQFFIGGERGADLDRGGDEYFYAAPLELELVVSPRLPLLHDRLELRALLLAGVSTQLFLEGTFPVRGSSPLNPYAFTEKPGIGAAVGAGLGLTAWLNERCGVFLELTVMRRHASARAKPGVEEFASGPFSSGLDLPESVVEIDETHGFVSFGFAYALEQR